MGAYGVEYARICAALACWHDLALKMQQGNIHCTRYNLGFRPQTRSGVSAV